MAGSDTPLAEANRHRSAGFRPDIEGLRAVAIGLVLVYHAGITFVPGGFVGVDVFFVISGFLITGLLVREVERTGRVSLSQFWARRAKRLLPASALMLAATTLATWLLVPATSWRTFGLDISAAALYVVNWRFAATSVDYDAEGPGVSPVLHFWSLAVEEQFYIVWPLLIVAVVALARRVQRSRLRPVLGAAITLILVPSFLWSLTFTRSTPDAAFFITTTRLWELGLGAAVALGAALWPRIPGAAAHALGWLGAGAIAVAALVITSDTPWPGSGALVPTLGTSAVIVATTGRAPGALGVGRLLGLRPMVWVGGLSYSWYLWHWPFLVLGTAALGELGEKRSVLLVLASGLVAWLSLKLVENPVRFAPSLSASPRLALSLGGNFSLGGALAGAALVLAVPAAAPVAGTGVLGARSLEGSSIGKLGDQLANQDTSQSIVPAPTAALDDLPLVTREDCVSRQTTAEVIECRYGAPEGATTVVVVGDSKIAQWTDAIAEIADREQWQLVTLVKSACAFAQPSYALNEPAREYCAQWNLEVKDKILELAPDAVLTSGRLVFDGKEGDDRTPGAERIAAWWTELDAAGIEVVPLLDNPAPPFEVYECVAENLDRLSQCSFDREAAIESSGAGYQLLAAELAGVEEVVDLTDIACPGVSRCPAVVGDVLLYRAGSHLTRTYVETATDALAEQLVPLVEAAAQD